MRSSIAHEYLSPTASTRRAASSFYQAALRDKAAAAYTCQAQRRRAARRTSLALSAITTLAGVAAAGYGQHAINHATTGAGALAGLLIGLAAIAVTYLAAVRFSYVLSN